MREPLTGLLLTKAQYESLALASTEVHREPLFPSWVEWNKLQMRAVGAAQKQGPMPLPWTIDVRAFHAWCDQVGTTPCIDELRNYSRTLGARIAITV